jgi:hypothetical protein
MVAAAAARFADVTTESEAIERVNGLMRRQLDAAARDKPKPNAALAGDSEAKHAFWMLLSPTAQRSLFLRFVKNHEFWPRIKPTVGSPPYSFLRLEDDGVLNATGIAANRSHMAPMVSSISSSHEIGRGQYVDDADRRFRVIADDHNTSPDIPARRVRFAKRVVVDVRVAAMSREDRLTIAKARDKKLQRAIVFPRPGERVKLTAHADLGISAPLELIVRTVEAKARDSPVARLYCVV